MARSEVSRRRDSPDGVVLAGPMCADADVCGGAEDSSLGFGFAGVSVGSGLVEAC